MSTSKRIISIATGVLILVLVYRDALLPDLPPGVVTVLLVLTLALGIILARMVLNEHASILAERTSTEGRDLLDAELLASKPLMRRLFFLGGASLAIGLAGFFGELALAVTTDTLMYPDFAIPAFLTLIAVGSISIILGSLIKHRFIRFPANRG